MAGLDVAGWRRFSPHRSARGSACERKTLLGIAEERGGRRGAGNAIANTGLAGCRGAAVGRHLRARLGAAGVRRRARGRRQRHSRQRDRQGVGPAHLPRADLRGAARDVRGGVARRDRSPASPARASWRASRSRSGWCPPRRSCRSSPARRSGRSPRACSARRSKAPGILNNDMLNFINTASPPRPRSSSRGSWHDADAAERSGSSSRGRSRSSRRRSALRQAPSPPRAQRPARPGAPTSFSIP